MESLSEIAIHGEKVCHRSFGLTLIFSGLLNGTPPSGDSPQQKILDKVFPSPSRYMLIIIWLSFIRLNYIILWIPPKWMAVSPIVLISNQLSNRHLIHVGLLRRPKFLSLWTSYFPNSTGPTVTSGRIILFIACPDHITISVRFQPLSCWELCWDIDVGPPLFTLLYSEMLLDGVRIDRRD